MQGEALAHFAENPEGFRAVELVIDELLRAEGSRMRSCVATGNMHEATLCEGRMQAMSEFAGELKRAAADYRKTQKGPLRDSL